MTKGTVQLAGEIATLAKRYGRTVRYMEVCGTHTVSLFRSGVRSMLPQNVKLISGPGCPVCVTAQRHIDAALELAAMDKTLIATYGDMLRVPGRHGSLDQLRARGAMVTVVASAMTALRLAERHPNTEVVFLAVGFETTAPATAVAVREAHRLRILNFSVLAYHKLVVPAMLALLADGNANLDGFLCPGHVSVIIGSDAYRPIIKFHKLPCVVAGFEPAQMLAGIRSLLRQSVDGIARIENVYPAAVSRRGNPTAKRLLEEVFVQDDAVWRSLGEIPKSGLRLARRFEQFDAYRRFKLTVGEDDDHPLCRCGEVIQGRAEPKDCSLFGRACTPATPIGPCMVSSEGTCAAWHRFERTHTRGTTKPNEKEGRHVTNTC